MQKKSKPNFELKALRAKYRITQRDMAKRLGIAVSSYNQKENGLRDFTLTECKIISEILKHDPKTLFFEQEVSNS
jgi:DNA-binding XRE family transcriptional regulator